MEYHVVIFWFLCLSCLSGIALVGTRLRAAGRGWIGLFLTILLVAVAGWGWGKIGLIYIGLAMWLLLVLCPALLSRLYYHHFLQQHYSVACRLARLISWLHPADGWRHQPQMIDALELAQRGDLSAATEILKRFHGIKSIIGLAAVVNLYRLTQRWEELLCWQKEHLLQLQAHPQLLPVLLRAYGETGDLRGMVELYERNKERIARLAPAASRDLCRLILFALCGKRQLVEKLFAGSLAILPPEVRQFWLATADLAAGDSESAQRQLEQLLPGADPPTRLAIERRLSRLAIRSEPLDISAEHVVEQAAREVGHDASFGAQPSLFSNQARATQLLIVLNLLMFAAEMCLGGSTNGESLYRLGALFPPAVRAGEWWRLATSLFLHFGALHLAMNMLGLWVLGPFVEFALGSWRFLLVYLLSGIGSMGGVMAFASGPYSQQLTLGASGCIMGLVGATGLIMLRGWLRERALSARRRLIAVLAIVGMQTLFDAVVPQVSMTAHLSGVVIGFALALMLRDSLSSARQQWTAPQPGATNSGHCGRHSLENH